MDRQLGDLRVRIDAVRAEAASLRRRNNDQFTSKETELGIERDRLAREQFGIEQSAESADTQVKTEQREVAKLAKQIEARETKAAAAEQRGDTDEARAELREYALGLQRSLTDARGSGAPGNARRQPICWSRPANDPGARRTRWSSRPTRSLSIAR